MTDHRPSRQSPAPSPSLRQRAEARVASDPPELDRLSPAGVRKLIHELAVHQAELEIQNEELRSAQLELSEARDRYLDLYQFAPVAYLSLDSQSHIRDANLTAATLFGVERRTLIGRRLEEYLVPADRDMCYRYLRASIEGRHCSPCELRLDRPDGALLVVHVDLTLAGDGTVANDEYRLVLTDVTRRFEAEAERERILADLRQALATVKTLRALLPMCAVCRRVRDDDGYWEQLEQYITTHTDTRFSHGLCPSCLREQDPKLADELFGPEES